MVDMPLNKTSNFITFANFSADIIKFVNEFLKLEPQSYTSN